MTPSRKLQEAPKDDPEYDPSKDGYLSYYAAIEAKRARGDKHWPEKGKPRPLSEKAIHTAVIGHWRRLGVPGSLVATIPNMKPHGQAGLTPGLPDLMVISPGLPTGVVGYIELKAATNHLSEAQENFAQLCSLRGIPWEVTYGRDEPIAVLERWGAVKKRGE